MGTRPLSVLGTLTAWLAPRSRAFSFLLLLCLVLPFAMASPGCASREEAAQVRDNLAAEKAAMQDAVQRAAVAKANAEAASASLAGQQAQLQQLLATLAAGSTERAAAEGALATVTAQLAQVTSTITAATKAIEDGQKQTAALGTRLAEVDRHIAAADAPSNPGGAIGSLLGLLIPGLAVASPGIGISIYRQLRLGRAVQTATGQATQAGTALQRVVNSIDLLATIAPEVGRAIEANKAAISIVQTPLGKAAVDQAQGKAVASQAILPVAA